MKQCDVSIGSPQNNRCRHLEYTDRRITDMRSDDVVDCVSYWLHRLLPRKSIRFSSKPQKRLKWGTLMIWLSGFRIGFKKHDKEDGRSDFTHFSWCINKIIPKKRSTDSGLANFNAVKMSCFDNAGGGGLRWIVLILGDGDRSEGPHSPHEQGQTQTFTR